MDYTKLRDLLAEGKFQDADDETRALLIKLAGPGAIDRKWVYFTEVRAARKIPRLLGHAHLIRLLLITINACLAPF